MIARTGQFPRPRHAWRIEGILTNDHEPGRSVRLVIWRQGRYLLAAVPGGALPFRIIARPRYVGHTAWTFTNDRGGKAHRVLIFT